MQPLTHVTLSSVADISMMAAKKPASPTKPTVGKNAKPLSPGSNCAPLLSKSDTASPVQLFPPALAASRLADPTTKNIQKQKSGFGSFVQKFQVPRRTILRVIALPRGAL